MIDLDAEYGQAWARTPAAILDKYEAARHFGLLGVARVMIERDRYQLCPGGELALIVAARGNPAGDPETDNPLKLVRGGPLLDLIAVPLARPKTWTLRRGTVCFIGAVEPQILKPDPVEVWRSPVSWLQHSCVGLALLTHDRRQQADILRGLDIIAEDEAHGRELRAILERPFPAPRIFTRKARAAT